MYRCWHMLDKIKIWQKWVEIISPTVLTVNMDVDISHDDVFMWWQSSRFHETVKLLIEFTFASAWRLVDDVYYKLTWPNLWWWYVQKCLVNQFDKACNQCHSSQRQQLLLLSCFYTECGEAGNLQELPHPPGLVCLMALARSQWHQWCRGHFTKQKKSLYKKIMFLCERACDIQALMFLTDGPGFKLMSPERIKMMDHHGLIFLKQCVTWRQWACGAMEAVLQPSRADSRLGWITFGGDNLFSLVGAVGRAIQRMAKKIHKVQCMTMKIEFRKRYTCLSYVQTCLSQQNQKQKLIHYETVKDEWICMGCMSLKINSNKMKQVQTSFYVGIKMFKIENIKPCTLSTIFCFVIFATVETWIRLKLWFQEKFWSHSLLLEN